MGFPQIGDSSKFHLRDWKEVETGTLTIFTIMLNISPFNGKRFQKKLKTKLLSTYPSLLKLVFAGILFFFVFEVFRPQEVHLSVRHSAKHLLNIDNDLFQGGKYDDVGRAEILSEDDFALEMLKDGRPRSVEEVLERYRLLNALKNKESTGKVQHEQMAELRSEAIPNIHQWSDMFMVEDGTPKHHHGGEEEIRDQRDVDDLMKYIKKNSAKFSELAQGLTATTHASLAKTAMKKVPRASPTSNSEADPKDVDRTTPASKSVEEESVPSSSKSRKSFTAQVYERLKGTAANISGVDMTEAPQTEDQASRTKVSIILDKESSLKKETVETSEPVEIIETKSATKIAKGKWGATGSEKKTWDDRKQIRESSKAVKNHTKKQDAVAKATSKIY